MSQGAPGREGLCRPLPLPLPLPLPSAEYVFTTVSTFDHQRLEVYRRTIDFVALVEEVVSDLPRGRSYVADQLRRATRSIALDIAEVPGGKGKGKGGQERSLRLN